MPKIRNIIIFLSIALLIGATYFFFLRSDDAADTSLVAAPAIQPGVPATTNTTASTNDAVAGENFLSLLLSVKNIKLEDAIFSDPAFRNLHDSSIVLTHDGTEGRPNPFARLGSDITTAVPPPASPAPVPDEDEPIVNPQ